MPEVIHRSSVFLWILGWLIRRTGSILRGWGTERRRGVARWYWRVRQNALPVDFQGDFLEPREVQFVERLLDAGQELKWIPRDTTGHKSTNDFIWLNNGAIEVEHKSTSARYKNIHGRIVDAASRAAKHGVTKDNFIIDLGDEPLADDLRSELRGFNVGRRKYRLSGLWVMSRGALTKIDLDAD